MAPPPVCSLNAIPGFFVRKSVAICPADDDDDDARGTGRRLLCAPEIDRDCKTDLSTQDTDLNTQTAFIGSTELGRGERIVNERQWQEERGCN